MTIALFQPPSSRELPYTISEINRGIKHILEEGVGVPLLFEAEVVTKSQAASGHIYLKLSDGSSTVSAVVWAGNRGRIECSIVAGALVHGVAIVRVYEKNGTYQLDIQRLWDAGAGKKAAQLEQLKKKLFEEGLFSDERKRKIPLEVNSVGVVTAEGSAAFSDIVKTVRKNSGDLKIVLSPALMQGEASPSSIVKALALFEKWQGVDVVILARGGGSREDLDAFDSEQVVRAIASLSIPVASGVGHEIDVTLADYAADVRCATPTAAAEFVTTAHISRGSRLRELQLRFNSLSGEKIGSLFRRYRTVCNHRGWRSFQDRVVDSRIRLVDADRKLLKETHDHIQRKRNLFAGAMVMLSGINPLKTLSRGFSVVRKEGGETVRSIEDLSLGDQIDIVLKDGHCRAQVNEVYPQEER